MLDVRDPNNFAVTLNIEYPITYGMAQESPYFVGIGPAGIDISQEWLDNEYPSVAFPALPCPDMHGVSQIEVHQGPEKSSFPPVIKEGVFFACPRFEIAKVMPFGNCRTFDC